MDKAKCSRCWAISLVVLGVFNLAVGILVGICGILDVEMSHTLRMALAVGQILSGIAVMVFTGFKLKFARKE